MRYSFNSHDAVSFQNAMFKQFADFFQKSLNAAASASTAQRIQEITELNNAYKMRASALQKMWSNDWSQLFESAKPTNSSQKLPDFAEQYSKFLTKSEEQIAKQMEEYAELMESTLSGYTYWLAKQIQNDFLH